MEYTSCKTKTQDSFTSRLFESDFTLCKNSRMKWRDKAKKMIKARGTMEEFSESAKIPLSTLSTWLNGTRTPELGNLEKLSRALGLSVAELLDESVGEEIEETNLSPRDFPLISWVQAGDWAEIVDNFQPGDAEMWVAFGIPRKDMPNAFCLRVRGDSMIPEFAEGDIILVDPHRQPENGSFVIAKLLDTQEATFKKYVVDAGNVSLLPLNFPKYEPIRLNGRKAVIVGVVVGKQKMY